MSAVKISLAQFAVTFENWIRAACSVRAARTALKSLNKLSIHDQTAYEEISRLANLARLEGLREYPAHQRVIEILLFLFSIQTPGFLHRSSLRDLADIDDNHSFDGSRRTGTECVVFWQRLFCVKKCGLTVFGKLHRRRLQTFTVHTEANDTKDKRKHIRRSQADTKVPMVITRRALKLSRSIIAWLPNEVLSSIIAYAANSELLSLCLTSRLMRKISTRFLYRVVHLNTEKTLELFLKPIGFHKLLQEGFFPNLVTFRYIVQPETASAFIFNIFASIRRSKLGTVSFEVSGLTSISLMWYPDDLDIDRHLSQLTEAKDLEAIVILTSSTSPTEVEILAGISRYIPHVKVLRFRSLVAKHVGLSMAIEIQRHLHGFSALSIIEFPAIDYNTEFRLDHDMQALKLWQGACKTIWAQHLFLCRD
ncbi:hypothetical protein R3P38DRAFT_2811601 [Favolaschia claudopus]|uniref:F-box domain-containing protein n=1 Tax=Favolaschia claudopus TaxID=2862362 RepID=A0AAV9Z9C6_9AGAR